MDKVIIIIFALISSATYANPTSCINSQEKIKIFHINGIATNPQLAQRNLEELASAIGTIFGTANITYALSYNDTSNVIIDLLQSAAQLGLQFSSQVMRWIAGSPGAPTWLQDLLIKSMQGLYPIIATELDDHVAQYRDAILQGNMVLLVSHSQGNLYANEAYEVLRARNPGQPITQSAGIYSVATPANNVAGSSSPYITNNRDFISLTPGALSENLTLKYASGSAVPELGQGLLTPIFAHSFIGSYLSPDFNARQPILDGIRARLASLQKPAESSDDGPITATLRWSGNVDLDLALLEPDGHFVSSRAGAAPGSTTFAPPAGHVGYIPADAEGGSGTETYRSNCNQLQTGSYYIGAQYAMDLTYAHASSESWCASLIADVQARGYGDLVKSYCGLEEAETSLAAASAQLEIHTPKGVQTVSLSWPAGSDFMFFGKPDSFILGARLDIREAARTGDPNQDGQLDYVITPAGGPLPLPVAWQAAMGL